MKTVGDRIRARREERGWSQSELARQAGLKQPTISELESGKQKSTRFIFQIADALGIPVEELRQPVHDSDAPRLDEGVDDVGAAVVGEIEATERRLMELRERATRAERPAADDKPASDADGRRRRSGRPASAPSTQQSETAAVPVLAREERPQGDPSAWASGLVRVPRDMVRMMGAEIETLAAVRMVGSSMEPAIHDGDIAIIDTSVRSPDHPGIYAVRERGIVLRNVELLMENGFNVARVAPCSAAFSEYRIPVRDLEIVGRYIGRFTTR